MGEKRKQRSGSNHHVDEVRTQRERPVAAKVQTVQRLRQQPAQSVKTQPVSQRVASQPVNHRESPSHTVSQRVETPASVPQTLPACHST